MSFMRGLGRAAGYMNTPMGKSMTAGALSGGMYGAYSRDTSVIGGAMMGGLAGRYGSVFARGASRGFKSGAYPGMGVMTTSTMGRAAIGGARGLRGVRGQMRGDYNKLMGMGRRAKAQFGARLRANSPF